MRTTTYSAIERGVSSIAGIDPDNVLAHEKSILAEYINDAVNYCWDYYPWGEFTITEKRSFRVPYDSSFVYDIGDEVFYENKFYRKHSNGTFKLPTSTADWHEIGDEYTDTPWLESGLYGIGAKVSHEGKHFVCIQESALGKTNYLTDGIDTTNSQYFYEVNPFFERFIPYEQTGYNTIGNCLGCYTDDPRYSNTQHLNFREGREGIYIDGKDRVNEFWMVYKIEAPTFTPTSTDSSIPRFLAQAIKAHAYQSWLVGEGQHEKAQLQELKILDLLVRETDKIDQYANKNKPFSIAPNSSELINSRQSQVVEGTPHLIGELAQRESELTFKLGTIVNGRNPFQKRTANLNLSTNVDGIVSQDILDPRRKYGTTTFHANLGVPAITGNAIKSTSVNSLGLSLGVVAEGRDYGQASGVDPIVMSLVVDPPYGNRVFSNEADLSFGLNVAGVSGNILFANRVEIDLGLDVSFDFTSPAIRVAMQDASSNTWLKWDDTQTYIGTSSQNRMSVNFTNADSHLEVGTYKLRYKLLSDTTAFNNSQNGVVYTDPSGWVSDPFILGSGSQRFSRIDPTREYQIWLLDEKNLSFGIDATINGQAPLYTNTLTNNGTESTIFTKSTGNIPYLSLVHHQNYRTGANTGVPQQPFNLPYDPVPYGAYYWKGHSEGSVWNFTPTQDQVTELTIQINTTQNNSRVVVVFAQDRGQNNNNINIFETESIQIIKI